MQLCLVWADFKEQLNLGLPFKYASINNVYYLVASNDLFEFDCSIPKTGSADQTDFETNYLSKAISFNLSPLAPGQYSNITGNSTVTVKASFGVLMGIWINNNSTGGMITVYDNTSGSGTIIGALAIGTPSGGILSQSGIPSAECYTALNVKFNTGLTVVTSGSTSNNITIIYR